MNEFDDKFAREAKSLFDASVDELDAATLSTLNQGRHQALAKATAQPEQWLRWVPAAGIAAATLLAVMVILPGPTGVEVAPATLTDMDILLDEDSIEMFEDLEFYTWIDMLEQDNDVG